MAYGSMAYLPSHFGFSSVLFTNSSAQREVLIIPPDAVPNGSSSFSLRDTGRAELRCDQTFKVQPGSFMFM
jgi:hypothetical protein